MKKVLAILCAALLLCGCSRSNYTLTFAISPGDGMEFTFSDQQLCPQNAPAVISAGAGVIQASILLIDETGKQYGPVLLTHSEPIRLKLEPGTWYRIGIAMPNDAKGPIAAELLLENVQLRIS